MAGVYGGDWVSQFFFNALWLFLGIVAGSLVQYFLNWMTLRKQRENAKRIFAVETAINRAALNRLVSDARRKKDRFTAGQEQEHDYFLDMSAFNYRIVDPLINTGHFHEILGPDGVAKYMKYANELNNANANNLHDILKKEATAGKSLNFWDWLIDTKVPEWESNLNYVENKLGLTPSVGKIERYQQT